jgi:hypothetical protein
MSSKTPREPVYNHEHQHITEVDAIDMFHPERLKPSISGKISKSQTGKTRWEIREPDSPLAVLSISKGNLDLCWWNGDSWTYITTIKTTC